MSTRLEQNAVELDEDSIEFLDGSGLSLGEAGQTLLREFLRTGQFTLEDGDRTKFPGAADSDDVYELVTSIRVEDVGIFGAVSSLVTNRVLYREKGENPEVLASPEALYAIIHLISAAEAEGAHLEKFTMDSPRPADVGET